MAWIGLELSDGTIVEAAQVVDSFDFGPGAALRTERGRPARDGEVWLSATLASEMDVDVGDTLSLAHPEDSWVVAGVAESDFSFGRRLLVMPDLPLSQFRDWVFPVITLVELSPTLSSGEVERIGM